MTHPTYLTLILILHFLMSHITKFSCLCLVAIPIIQLDLSATTKKRFLYSNPSEMLYFYLPSSDSTLAKLLVL